MFLFFRRNKGVGFKEGSFEVDFMLFSSCSLAIIYGVYLLLDPWQLTHGNNRMAMPLLPHLFIWAALFYKKIDECPIKSRIFLRIILISSMVSMICGYKKERDVLPNKEMVRLCYSMQDIKRKYYPNDKPMVCIIGKDYFEIVELFIAPALYMNRRYILPKDGYFFDTCDMMIAPSNFMLGDPGFSKYDIFHFYHKVPYAVYLKEKIF